MHAMVLPRCGDYFLRADLEGLLKVDVAVPICVAARDVLHHFLLPRGAQLVADVRQNLGG